MGTRLSGQALINKLTDFVEWLSQRRQPRRAPAGVDLFRYQIYQIEKTLADTQPMSTARSANKPVEPMTEQQKIMDLAG